MALLTASQDPLRYDKLIEGSDDNDPLGKSASNRIRILDKDLGFAMHPEEKEAALGYKKEVDAAASKQSSALNKYKSQ